MKQTEIPQPKIIYDAGSESTINVDAAQVGDTMRTLGIAENAISDTTILIDSENHLANKGRADSRLSTRLRHIANPVLRNAPGATVRISTTVRGTERTEEEMNHTLVHELEHVAQIDRKDKRLLLGHVTIMALAFAGGYLGSRVPKSKPAKIIAGTAGAVAGHTVGYSLASHEKQARAAAEELTTAAISRK